MRALTIVISALSAAALAAPAGAVSPGDAGDAGDATSWDAQVVPAASLADLRGGVDLGQNLVGYFAIDRSISVDGEVVARMQIVISNVDRLGNGGMPTVKVSGPLAELVQILNAPNAAAMKLPAAVGAAAPGAADPANTPATPAAPGTAAVARANPTSTADPAHTPTVISPPGGNTGSTSARGTQSGSLGQFASALGSAVSAASGATGGTNTGSGAAAGNGDAGASQASTPAQSGSLSAPSLAQAAPASAPAASAAATAGISRIVPVGTTGQVVVVSNLPNATAISTAVQNQVHGASIQAQTTISASVNSLTSLNAVSLGNAIRQQVSTSVAGGGQ